MNEVNTQATHPAQAAVQPQVPAQVETPAPVVAQATLEVESPVVEAESIKEEETKPQGYRYKDEDFEKTFAKFEASSMTESKYVESTKGDKKPTTTSGLRAAVLYSKGLLINEPAGRYRRDRKEMVSQYFADLEIDLNETLSTVGNDISKDRAVLLKSTVVQELAKELALHTPFLDLLKYAGIDPETSSMSDLANKLFTAKFTKKS